MSELEMVFIKTENDQSSINGDPLRIDSDFSAAGKKTEIRILGDKDKIKVKEGKTKRIKLEGMHVQSEEADEFSVCDSMVESIAMIKEEMDIEDEQVDESYVGVSSEDQEDFEFNDDSFLAQMKQEETNGNDGSRLGSPASVCSSLPETAPIMNSAAFDTQLTIFPTHDIICGLLEEPFSRRNEFEKGDILCCGRPQPAISVSQRDLKNCRIFSRWFNCKYYDSHKWLCGSCYTQTLFCWPCVLFGERKNVWNTRGYSELKNFIRQALRHENSKDHLFNALCLKRAEKNVIRIQNTMLQNATLLKRQFNEKVRLNRLVLHHLIDIVIFLGKQSLAFRGCDESENKGNYKEMWEVILRRTSPEIQAHYKTIEPVLSENSEAIQNELIECVQEIIFKKIEADIAKAPFFAVEMNDISAYASKAQNSISVRFVDDSGEIVERFLGFFDVTPGLKADILLNLLDTHLQKYDYKNKLIAQTNNGAGMIPRELSALQTAVKASAPAALFTHCSGHRLSSVFQKGLERIPVFRIFFAHVVSISTFFHDSPEDTNIVAHLRHEIPEIAKSRWSSPSKTVHKIVDFFPELKSVFQAIIDDPESSPDSIARAAGFLNLFSNFDFVFFALIFNDIFGETDGLSNVLQKKSLDIYQCVIKVGTVKQQLFDRRKREYADRYFDKAVELISTNKSTAEENTRQEKFLLYCDIINNIVAQMIHRFCDLNRLQFLELVDASKFRAFQDKFPTTSLSSLLQLYPTFFPDPSRLPIELQIFYKDAQFVNKSVTEMLQIMKAEESDELYREVYKLLCLVASIPATHVSTKRSFSCSNRILTYLRSTVTQQQLSNLAFLSVEKSLLSRLMEEANFYDQVVDKFARKKPRRFDLSYTE